MQGEEKEKDIGKGEWWQGEGKDNDSWPQGVPRKEKENESWSQGWPRKEKELSPASAHRPFRRAGLFAAVATDPSPP